ncbi:MAG: hypothetical protein ACOYBY_14305 [Dermatophilaceae bacterium]
MPNSLLSEITRHRGRFAGEGRRSNRRVLDAAGVLEPAQMRPLDAIHLATAQLLGEDLGQVVTYDDRMADAARQLGLKTVAPA